MTMKFLKPSIDTQAIGCVSYTTNIGLAWEWDECLQEPNWKYQRLIYEYGTIHVQSELHRSTTALFFPWFYPPLVRAS